LREAIVASDGYGIDGNRDGIQDAEQGQVAGIRLVNDGSKFTDFGALAVDSNIELRGVRVLPIYDDGTVVINLSDGSSVQVSLPTGISNTLAGAISFELAGLTAGGSTEALIYLPYGYTGDGSAYVRYNYATSRFEDYCDTAGNRLYTFTDTDDDGFVDAIALTLVDGDPQWDGDGVANGAVLDPGFLASGAAEINGDRRQNTLVGNILANQIRGKGKHDALIGDLGDDFLRGGNGADRLCGGEGADVLIGGRGADRYIYRSIVESGVERSDQLQFGRGDQIDLRRIDADENRRGNQVFHLVMDATFSGKAGELRLFESKLLGDVDGDRRADFAIALSSKQMFTADVLLL
jgi:hypothetical protein